MCAEALRDVGHLQTPVFAPEDPAAAHAAHSERVECSGVKAQPFLPLEAVAEQRIGVGREGAGAEAGVSESLLQDLISKNVQPPRNPRGTHGEPTGEAAKGSYFLCEPRKWNPGL